MLQQQGRTRSELNRLRSRTESLEQGLLDSPGDALAGAEIQGLVRDIAAAQGLTIQNSDLAPVEGIGPRYGKVSTRISLSGGIHQVVDFIAAMGSGPRILFVEDLRIAPVRVQPSQGQGHSGNALGFGPEAGRTGAGRRGSGGSRRPRPQGRLLVKRRTVQANLVLVGLAALWVYLLADNRGRFEAGRQLDSSGIRCWSNRRFLPSGLPGLALRCRRHCRPSPLSCRPPQRPPRGGFRSPGNSFPAFAGTDGNNGLRRGGLRSHGFQRSQQLRQASTGASRRARPWTATPWCGSRRTGW